MVMTKPVKDIVIDADDAVFWMDDQGRWCNAGGRIRHKRTADYLNRCIGHDAGGWFVRQRRENIREKVYFRCGPTALFAVDVAIGDKIVLALNTGRRRVLKPRRLVICNDLLYQIAAPAWIKFSDRAATKLAALIEEDARGWAIRVGGRRYRLLHSAAVGRLAPEKETKPTGEIHDELF